MSPRLQTTLTIVSPLLFLVLAGESYWYIQKQDARYAELKERTDAQVQLLASTTVSLSQSIRIIEGTLSENKNFNAALVSTLAEEQGRASSFQQELQKVTGTVGTLDKLSKTDKELLQKYSKIYFLNEHYIPESLTLIEQKYWYEKNHPLQFHTKVLPHLSKLLADATLATTTIFVESAYRSFYDQAHLKSGYSMVYGAGTANKFSADQGYSEHQLGTTVDFTTPEVGGVLTGFDKTPAFKWLQTNAYQYGFILSYPKDNGYYVYEPWHWRYIGVALATKLHNEGKTFYGTDQRVIDEYLISIFD